MNSQSQAPSSTMKVLFLTCRLSYGHTRVAQAVARELESRHPGVTCDYLDLWSLMDERVAAAVQDAFGYLSREYPELYQRLSNLDKGLQRQLSGKEPAEPELKALLLDRQKRWFPEAFHRWPFVPPDNLDQALINSLIGLVSTDRSAYRSKKVMTHSLLLFMRSAVLNRLKRRVLSLNPDVVVATHMYPSALISQLKRQDDLRTLPAVGTVTDFGLQSMWVRPATDLYCVASEELRDQLTKYGVPDNCIYKSGMPLMPEFSRAPSMAEARRQLGISPERNTIVISEGEYGGGLAKSVEDFVLADTAHQVLVTSGYSGDDRETLQQLEKYHTGQMMVFDEDKARSVVFSAADVVVGPPVGLNIGEALACGRPFVGISPLGCQEHHNIAYLERNGVGMEVSCRQLSMEWQRLLQSPRTLSRMQARANAVSRRDGAYKVANQVEQLHQTRQSQHQSPQSRY